MDGISFPEWLTPQLVVSIGMLIATITGVVIAHRKLRPGLRVKATRCVHSVRYIGPIKQNAIAGTQLSVEFTIRNTGARTSIYDVEIRCKPMGQFYRTTEKVQSIRAVTVKKGDTITYSHQFYIPRRGVFETSLSCTFFLHHAYGKTKVKTKSNFQGAR